jgi:GDPmannose 4,6-dehydratase
VQLVGCIDKIKTQLGWQPQYSFEQLVEVMVNYDLKELTESQS